MAILAESSWFSSVSPSKCSVSHLYIPSLSLFRVAWYLQLIKRRQIKQENLRCLEVKFSPRRPGGFFFWESFVGFAVDQVALRKVFLWVLRLKLGSHSTEAPLSLSTRAGTVTI